MALEMHFFKIPIGDWSQDGHGKCNWHLVESNKPVEAVREAFFTALSKHPKIDPTKIASDYEDSTIDKSVVDELLSLGFTSQYFNGEYYCDELLLLDIILFFLKLEDNDLTLHLIKDDHPMLNFYGRDKQNRHISGFGYGLFD